MAVPRLSAEANCGGGVMLIGAALSRPPAEVTLVWVELVIELSACRAVVLRELVLDGAPAAAGALTPLGDPAAPAATAHAGPDFASLAP